MARIFIVGLISDTHGHLRPQALDLLRGSDLIVHAGDVGNADILPALARIAPVTAVRGNIDTAAWAASLPDRAVVTAGDATRLYVLHNIADLDIDPAQAGYQAVIYGHSHKPFIGWSNGVLMINPGSAGPRRFSLPICLGRLTIDGAGGISAELLHIGA